MSEETIPVAAYALYLEGLTGLQKKYSISLFEAYQRAVQDAIQTQGTEHLPFLNAAYQQLVEQTLLDNSPLENKTSCNLATNEDC